jgi:hypothetical protein
MIWVERSARDSRSKVFGAFLSAFRSGRVRLLESQTRRRIFP